MLRAGAGALLGGAAAGCAFVPENRAHHLEFLFWGSIYEDRGVHAVSRAFSRRPGRLPVAAQVVGGDYATKINTLVAARQEPDIAYLPAGLAMRLGEGGLLVNLLDYRHKYPQIDDLLPQALHYYTETAAVPQTAVEVMMLWYSTRLFSKAGVPEPPVDTASAWSWDRYLETCDRLTFDEKGRRPSEKGFDPTQVRQFGATAPTTVNTTLYALLRSNGADLFDEKGTRCIIDSDAAVEVVSQIVEMMYEHRVAPSPTLLTSMNTGTALLLKSGRVATTIDGYWNLLDLANAQFPYGAGVLPKFQEPMTAQTSGITGIFKRSQYPEQAVEFYLQMADPRSCPLYKQGLWMPLERSFYTDPKLLATWTDTKIHPAGFDRSTAQPALHNVSPDPTFRIRNSSEVFAQLTPALDPIWLGKHRGTASVRKALRHAADVTTPFLAGVYPDVKM
ncbi:hypothetical protein BIV57_16850 [Mangrovactinospora gilvigrisea]|uniref:ABC transporter substrate-binding protein n=1 Tax=Mangrovactinospora gilvigrisea TaxID=1428644 RepID=A0A1J7C9J3_9ACTN|nr:extracellular solute-binding protein [Mangrovactinospora gilvigrisea]OIV36314.1 hypothetical protein BIV57_16850 [Mangrovactinospora gilvigrisea]